MRRLFAVLVLLAGSPVAWTQAATMTDATGRSVTVPDHPERILPAGPPAAVLLAALAPDLMIGFPNSVSLEARALLSPATAELPSVPRLTGRADVVEELAALHPDLVLDYGDVTPRYTELIKSAQDRLGVPAILLDGTLAATPAALRQVGQILHREGRAEALARVAEALLTLPATASRTVVYARAPDGLTVAAPGTEATAVLERLGWKVLAPAGEGWFRPTDLAQIIALDPDVLIFADPAMRDVLARPGPWTKARAVREHHAYIAPSLPFGWIEAPPSINRLLGLAWLHGGEPSVLGGVFNAVVYDRTLSAATLAEALASTPSVR